MKTIKYTGIRRTNDLAKRREKKRQREEGRRRSKKKRKKEKRDRTNEQAQRDRNIKNVGGSRAISIERGETGITPAGRFYAMIEFDRYDRSAICAGARSAVIRRFSTHSDFSVSTGEEIWGHARYETTSLPLGNLGASTIFV